MRLVDNAQLRTRVGISPQSTSSLAAGCNTGLTQSKEIFGGGGSTINQFYNTVHTQSVHPLTDK